MRTDALRRLALAATLLLGACLERRPNANTVKQNECTRCHGDGQRAASALLQAAPPIDLAGNTDPSYPGVGAHQIHLNGSATHEAFPCATCHIVPETVESPGHADAAHAQLTFGGLALQDGHSPGYDYKTRRCTDTYCHRAANPEWTKPRTSAEACGTCHGLPPAAPHPQSTACYKCHTETVDAQRNIIDPSKHVNGVVDVGPVTCHNCHGSAQSNAPPVDLSGNTNSLSPGVGAHQIHLSGDDFFKPVDCPTCHKVPTNVSDPGHLDNTPGAEVTFSGIALNGGAAPTYDRTTHTCLGSYCHGPVSPATSVSPNWTTTGFSCTTCHGYPPAAPHPQMTNCQFCHTETMDSTGAITAATRDKHVDGTVEVTMPIACNACHGSATSNAPPKDVEGETATTARGVGAHQSHLSPDMARPVPCNECHIVPAGIFDPGHLDTPRPAELTFSGVAVTSGAPAFDGVKCSNTYCHGDAFPNGRTSGGALTQPQWTKVDGTQDACGNCHGLPPPAPHPTLTSSQTCSDCHTDIAPDLTFTNPALHVNGRVD